MDGEKVVNETTESITSDDRKLSSEGQMYIIHQTDNTEGTASNFGERMIMKSSIFDDTR